MYDRADGFGCGCEYIKHSPFLAVDAPHPSQLPSPDHSFSTMNIYGDDVDKSEDVEAQLPHVTRFRSVGDESAAVEATAVGTLAALWQLLDDLGTTVGLVSLLGVDGLFL
jgi:hypothetical protein